MCNCSDDEVSDHDRNFDAGAAPAPVWAYAPFPRSGPSWCRFQAVPRQPWYGTVQAVDTSCFVGCVIKERGRDATGKTGMGVLTSLSKEQFAATPVAALKAYMEVHCGGAVPFFCEDGRAIVTLKDGSLVALTLKPDGGLHVAPISPAATLLLDTNTVVRGSVTSCVGNDVTIVRILSPAVSATVAAQPPRLRDQWSAYNQYGRNAILQAADADTSTSGTDDTSRPQTDTVINGVVYRGVVTILPPTMHAVWLSLPRKALFVTQFGRAILVGEDVLASMPAALSLSTMFEDAFVKYVSYDVPEMTSAADFYKPVTPLPASNMYDVVVVSGRGEAALIRIQGAFRMVTVSVNVAVGRSALRRARDEHYLPGDVLIEYRTERLFLVCTYVIGTVVVRRLHPRTGVMSPPQRLDSRTVTKGIIDGRWSLLPPAIVDVSVGRRFVWLLAGNTRYRTRTGLLHEEGHTTRPCGSFSVTHVPDRIGSDGDVSWTSMNPEAGGFGFTSTSTPTPGFPIVLCGITPVQR